MNRGLSETSEVSKPHRGKLLKSEPLPLPLAAASAIGGSAKISLGRRLMAKPVRTKRQILRISLVFILIEITYSLSHKLKL